MSVLAPTTRRAPRGGPDPDLLLSVLSEVARAVSRSLELRDVFARVAEAVSRVLPFEAMGVSIFEAPSTMVLYAIAGRAADAEEPGQRYAVDDMSPLLSFHGGGRTVRRVADARTELDTSFRLDREIVENGSRSLLYGPLFAGETLLGGLWFASLEQEAYTEGDEDVVRALADLASLALQHERLAAVERERRRRREVLERLVPTLAKALDVRDVFDQVSAITHEVLPHDRMVMGLLDEDGQSARIHAYSGERVPDLPETIRFSDPEKMRRDWDFEIIEDVEHHPDPQSEKCQILRREGLRSVLRVPIRLEGRVIGGLSFNSKTPNTYRESDVDIARRVADQVALALSHQRLAEEARKSAAAREQSELLTQRIARLTEELELRDGAPVIGRAKRWRDVLVQATKVAITETTVLLMGESGTGKEVIARAIHRASPRSEGPFVALNCAALPDQLLESELFGYERGAFTGAQSSKPGRLEQAAGGTLFLDEVGEMSPVVQAKLLRVLQEREFQRLGGTRALKADVRVIAATNRDLAAAIARGEFREDLYYRLHVFEIHLPPLRDRAEDILPLTESFLLSIGRSVGRPAAGISKEARELLLTYRWPGNVRELRNALERAVILAEGGLITAAHLPISVAGAGKPEPVRSSAELPAAGVDLEEIERDYVVKALERAGNNKSRAARLLGITRAQLYSRLEKYGLG